MAGALLALTHGDHALSRAAHDLQLRLLARTQPSAAVVVFDIDDASLAALRSHLGTWPFNRDVYALVIETLRELGARAVALDLLLADPAAGDAALARTLARPGAPVLLAAAGIRAASDRSAPLSMAAPQAGSAAAAAAQPGQGGPLASGAAPAPGAVPAYAWPAFALPTASVWPAGLPARLGVITAPLDDDGVLRALPLWHSDATQRLPVMPWALLQALQGDRAAPPPLDARGSFALTMPAAAAWPASHPFAELALGALGALGPLDGRDAAPLRQFVKDRVVFIGSSALLADAVMTPQGQVSGTVVLAEAYASLHEGRHVRPRSALLDALLVVIALVPALAVVRRARPSLPHDAAMTAGTLLVLGGIALTALLHAQQPSEWPAAFGALLVGAMMTVLVHHRGQAAARRRLAHELLVSEEAARAKGAFLANVSHEIRTPLNALLGVAELLSQSELTSQQRLQVQVFREAGQTLHTLINDLLDLARIEAGRVELQAAPFDLRHALTQLTTLLRARAEDKGLNLVLAIDDALPTFVLGDRMRLEQSLMNLVGNAIKFTARGEVRLAAAPEAPDAAQAVQGAQSAQGADVARGSGRVRFDVTDTGIGIAPSKIDAIFEPFAQADGSVTRLYGGTGLGLSITRSIAALMGGSIQVRSAPGVGSTFTLRVPLPAAPQAAAAATQVVDSSAAGATAVEAAAVAAAVPLGMPATPVPAVAGAPEAPPPALLPEGSTPVSVLLAEDNEINAYLFRMLLENQPLAIEYAPNGAAALDMLRRRRYDIAFIDVQMPGLDGLSVTRELRTLEARSGRPRTPVVALTAHAFASDVQASLDAGCDRHLAKPFSRAQLVDAVRHLATPLAEAPPPSAADTTAVLDREAAIERLDGNAALYQRLAEHAAVFIGDWVASFDLAWREGSRERAHRLSHDLKSVAASVGAHALAEQAALLEESLHTPESALDERALAATRAALTSALAALTAPPPAGPP